MHRIAVSFVVMSVLLLALPAMAQEAPVYTYVAHWNVPRAQWAEFTAFGEDDVRPVLERMLADGTIVAWANFATEVHVENGITHGVLWSATSIAGIERALAELTKLPSVPAAVGAAKHSDLLLRSLIHRGGTAGPTSGYVWVFHGQVQPGRGGEWRDLWEQYFKPVYDELLDNGTILAYHFAVEYVHTQNSRRRFIWYVAPNAEALEKVNAALAGVFQNNPTLRAAHGRVTVRSEHRDYFARYLNYAHK